MVGIGGGLPGPPPFFDEGTLIPLIKDALARNPELKIWASPWCPPQWMKRNGSYASKPLDVDGLKRFMHKLVPAMKEEGVQVFFGTVERPSVGMVDAIFEDPELGREVGGEVSTWR